MDVDETLPTWTEINTEIKAAQEGKIDRPPELQHFDTPVLRLEFQRRSYRIDLGFDARVTASNQRPRYRINWIEVRRRKS